MPRNKLTIMLNGLVKEALVRRPETAETKLARKAHGPEEYPHRPDEASSSPGQPDKVPEPPEGCEEPSTP